MLTYADICLGRVAAVLLSNIVAVCAVLKQHAQREDDGTTRAKVVFVPLYGVEAAEEGCILYSICVRILLYLCPHTTTCLHTSMYVS
jgi:hypothetical protein